MDDLTIAVNTIVESYFKELLSLAIRSNMPVTAATINLSEQKRQIIRKNNIKKVEHETDFILKEFDDIHRIHVEEFWEHVNNLLTEEGKEKIVDIRLKEAFKEFQVDANRAIFRIKSNTSNILNDFKHFEIVYREKEVTNLNQITTDILYDSWMNRVNPVSGEKV